MMKPRRAATLQDIAKQAGVTASAVSYVLNDAKGRRISEKTREQVKSIARELNYVPHKSARSLKTGSSRTIAACFSGFFGTAMHDPYSFGLIRGILKEVSTQDYALQIITEENRKASHGGVDGWISIMGHESLDGVTEGGQSVIYLDPARRFKPYSFWADNGAAGELLARKIKGQSQRVLLIHHLPYAQEPYAYQQRSDTLRTAFESSHSEGAIETLNLDPVAYTPAEKEMFCDALKKSISGGTDTIICVSDLLAQLVQSFLLQAGIRCPEDVRLIGFDNTPHSTFASPAITTVDLGIEELGAEVCRCLIELIEGREVHFVPPAPKWVQRATYP